VAEGVRANVGKGVRVLWLEVTNVSNPNGLEGLAAVSMSPQVGSAVVGSELAYCWIHDNYASGVGTGINGLSSQTGAHWVHHNVVDGNRNNMVVIDGGNVDVEDNILRESGSPSLGHPDGIQGSLVNVRINRNRIGNSSGGTMYSSFTCPYGPVITTNSNPGGSYNLTNTYLGFITNTIIANNFFFKTRDVGSTALSLDTEVNSSSSGPTTTDLGGGIFRTNWTVASMLISNFTLANNTFWSSADAGIGITLPHNANSSTTYTNVAVLNNLILSRTNSGTPISLPTEALFDFNIVCGAMTNILRGVTSYDNAEDFNLAVGTTGNKSTRPLCYDNLINWNLRADDTIARGAGTNLATLATAIGYAGLTTDIAGVARGSSPSIGAFQSMNCPTNAESGLLMRLTFENDFYSTTNQNASDVSGYEHHGMRFGYPSSRTNFPVPIVSFNGTAAGNFRRYPSDILNCCSGQYYSFDYMAMTNKTAAITNMTNCTIMGWVTYDDTVGSPSATIMGNNGLNDLGVWHFGRNGNPRTGFTLSTNIMIPDDNFLRFPDENVTNEWHHYAVTWNGDTHVGIAFYDGVPCWTNSTSATNVFGLRIAGVYLAVAAWPFEGDPILQTVPDGGNDNYPNTGGLNGSMDELRIYNRVLSDSEIYELGQVPDFGNPTSEGGGGGESSSAPAYGSTFNGGTFKGVLR
jgi:hypothetical protein